MSTSHLRGATLLALVVGTQGRPTLDARPERTLSASRRHADVGMEGVRKQAALAHAVSLASDRKQTAPPTSPAAPADPDAERAAAWTEAERHETCGPRPGMYWLFGIGHKTGTELMDHFVNVSAGQSATNREQVNLEDGVFSKCFGDASGTLQDDSHLLDASCLAAAQATANRVILFRGGVLEEQELETALHNWQAQRLSTDNLRIVNSVRDPLEVIKSAYFYHLRGFEPSQREVPSKMIAVLKRKCDGGENKPDDELCAALHAHDAATTSYAQLLQRLPPRLGILAEAAYEVRAPRQRSVGGAAALAAAHPGVMTTLELADVFEDFDATFRRLLRFLGVPEADVGACLAAISSLDVSSCVATPARCPAACL